MSVLIKGMEMPTAGTYLCELGVLDENTAVLTVYTPIDKPQVSYKLVPVPEHGDLIDRDALMEEHAKAEKLSYTLNNTELFDTLLVGGNRFIQRFVAAPTIIPASKEGEG